MQTQPSRSPGPARKEEPFLTYAILAIIAVIFLYYESLSIIERNLLLDDWAKINERVYDGEYYRLFTSMFLHLNLMHIMLNGWALYLYGRLVELVYGHGRFAVIYLVAGLSGSVGSLLFTDAASIGASGAIFGVFGAAGVFFYRFRHRHRRAARAQLQQMAFLVVLNVALGFSPGSRIDNAAHIGGMIGGVLVAWMLCPVPPEYEAVLYYPPPDAEQ